MAHEHCAGNLEFSRLAPTSCSFCLTNFSYFQALSEKGYMAQGALELLPEIRLSASDQRFRFITGLLQTGGEQL